MVLSLDHWFKRAGTGTSPATSPVKEPLEAAEQFALALKFAGGEGVVQDFSLAALWYAQAAEQNHSLAQLNLAMLYGQGLGVARDAAKSRQWLTRSASLGNAAAQYRLGIQQHFTSRNSKEESAPEARIEALKWVRLSAAQGERGAEDACEFVALGMTREEVTEAERRAASFVANTEPSPGPGLKPKEF